MSRRAEERKVRLRIRIAGPIATVVVGLIFPAACGQTPGVRARSDFPSSGYPGDPNQTIYSDLRDAGRYRYRETRVLTKGPLAAAPADRDAFRAFLRNRNTGLLRLMPGETYGRRAYPGSNKQDAFGIRGGGAYYSFADITHQYGYGSDIGLEHDTLSTGFAGADYGILTNLGDVPLEEITLQDPRTSWLAGYQARRNEAEARGESMRFNDGMKVQGALYRSQLPLEINATYLLRSMIFGSSDVLVAFRIVRQDPDGSAIILWKRLKQYSISASERNR